MGSESTASTKADAWDAVGLDFWRRGRKSAKPSPGDIRWFLRDVTAQHRCMIVGGTSVGLIRAALERGADVTVVDFSERVCTELRQCVTGSFTVVCADILALGDAVGPAPTHLLSDTLINRMDGGEAAAFAASSARVLPAGSILRATVYLGFYEMDRRLLRLGLQAGCTKAFWDPETATIDFARVPADLLERGLVPHGGISRSQLVAWYQRRGREKRFSEADLRRLFAPPRWRWAAFSVDEGGKRARIELAREGG